MKRNHWQREISKLDPNVDYEQIGRIVGQFEFPWDTQQSLSFALFRTYAVPSIGRLLYDTGQFTQDVQKRHDDTALILEDIADKGLESPTGRAGVRRMNQMHGSYNISNDDMRYVLSTFVVSLIRWVEKYGWRDITDDERLANTRYYQRLGRLMGIKDVPDTYQGFSELMDSYERETYVYDRKCRAVADSTLDLFMTFYPRGMRRTMRKFAIALLDDNVRETFGFDRPAPWMSKLAHGSLRARGRLIRFFPARRKASMLKNTHRIRSYPNGYLIERLGTFPSTMPDIPEHAAVEAAAS